MGEKHEDTYVPDTHPIIVNRLINKVVMDAVMEIRHGHSNMDFYSGRQSGYRLSVQQQRPV
jgi:hypothetical protein